MTFTATKINFPDLDQWLADHGRRVKQMIWNNGYILIETEEIPLTRTPRCDMMDIVRESADRAVASPQTTQ